MAAHPASPIYRRYALALLLAVNLLNYIDRQVLYAVFPLVKVDLKLTDTMLGLLGSAFMVCYMVSAPLLGWLGDRGRRTVLASWGLVLWSLATGCAGFAPGYRTLLAARTAVGIGEASFGTVAPGLLADYFPRERRGRIFSLFYLAIPVGSALGYLFGGFIGGRWGWHAAFLAVGLPGLLLALPLRLLQEPQREDTLQRPERGGFALLFRNRSFVINTLAMAAMTFALGGLAQWAPTFICRTYALDVQRANALFGAITVAAGIGGTVAGGWLGDRLQRRTPKGYLLVSGWGFVIGVPAMVVAITGGTLAVCLVAVFVAEFFLFFNTGPLNAVIANVTAPGRRSTAYAVNIFFIHALGDALSPIFIGRLSDLYGLAAALLVTPAAVAAAAGFCFLCARYYRQDVVRFGDEAAQ